MRNQMKQPRKNRWNRTSVAVMAGSLVVAAALLMSVIAQHADGNALWRDQKAYAGQPQGAKVAVDWNSSAVKPTPTPSPK